ncbi:OB fold (BOF) protein [Roseobacter denitrificans OCh 114]|nr:OB fold (BOF) protein [Roseobacter denitrificans OCh 114]
MINFFVITAVLTLGLTTAHATGMPTPIDALERGTIVTVEGTVAQITDEDEFRLQDDTGTVRVYVGRNWVPADVGDAVRIEGFVDDDLFGPMEIYARTLTHADGTVVTLDGRYE